MLSESQERMLVVPRKGAEAQVQAIFHRWGLEAAVVGRVTDDGLLRLLWRGEVAAEVPAEALSGGAPAYSPPARRPAWLEALHVAPLPVDLDPEAAGERLAQLLARPNLADKAWVFEQYDTMVRTNTVVGPGSDAAVLRLPGTERGLALAIDCNSRFCYLDPRAGARLAVAECALNLAASGATPLAITDGMNFGNPEKPEVYWQFTQAVEGIAEACRALGTPVTGGNVSFYNESQEPGAEPAAIFPTPIIGMIGVLDDVRTAVRQHFSRAGDEIWLLGEPAGRLGGSEYWAMTAGRPLGRPADVDLARHARLIGLLVEAARRGLIRSAHDVSDGGLAIACAEATWGGVGAQVDLPALGRLDETLFGEAPSRVLLAVDPACRASFEALAAQHEVPAQRLGQTGGERLLLQVGGRALLDRSIHELKRIWQEALPARMGAAETTSR
ncbi:MAG TPA: AIR synthase-related protein [Limnochordia bacterium]|nr:AIR synthase-related protein [Limnochordia bacterium]